MPSTAIRFGLVGIINTVVGYSVICVGIALLGLNDVASNMLGYAVGLTCSFILNRRWTFRHDGKLLPSLLRFLLVFGIAYAANLVVVVTSYRTFHVNIYLAQLCGMCVYTMLSFLGSHWYAFPQATRTQP